MAEASSNGVSKLLECSLCLEVFKQPKCLPCIHTFCLKCLTGYVENIRPYETMTCPLCREKFSAPREGLSSLPNNFFIQSMIDLNQISNNSVSGGNATIGCDLCTVDPDKKCFSVAKRFCLECDQNMCETCAGYHSKIKSTKSHRIVQLSEKQDLSANSRREITRYCSKHKDDPLRIYCLPCEVAVCLVCMVTDHNRHSCKEIKDMSSNFRDKFGCYVSDLKKIMISIEQKYKEIKSTEKMLLDEAAHNEIKIKERCLELKRGIDRLEEELLNDSYKFRDEKTKLFKTDINVFQFQRNQLESYVKYLEELNKNGSDLDIVSGGNELLKKAESFTAKSLEILNFNSKVVHHKFCPSSGDDVKSEIFGEIIAEGQTIVIFGLDNYVTMPPPMCEINVNNSNRVEVIDNSTPVAIGFESAACVVNYVLYAVGVGRNNKELWGWSPNRGQGKWSRYANMPAGRRRHCVASVGDKIYVLGGSTNRVCRAQASVFCYDIDTDGWTQLGYLRISVQSAACVTFKKRIYIFGGEGRHSELDCVQIYDPATRYFSVSDNPMPSANKLLKAVIWKSKAILVGYETCYIYDFDSDSWQERERFYASAIYFGLTIENDTLYISGGGISYIDKYNKTVWRCNDEIRSVYVYDLISDEEESHWYHYAYLPAGGLMYAFNSVPVVM